MTEKSVPEIGENPVPTRDTMSLTSLPKRHRLGKQMLRVTVIFLLAWLVVAYLLLPALWKRYASRHPSLEDIPGITHTGVGIPGDPLCPPLALG